MKELIGTGVALVTPMLEDRTIDYNGLSRLIEHVSQDKGPDFLVVNGTTAESPTMTKSEIGEILQFVKENNPKKLPIVFGIGGNSTLHVVEDFKHYNLDGVTAILSVSPYYNKPQQQGIIEHYKALDAVTELPIIVYNVPGRTQSNILPETTFALSRLKNIVGIKEASNNLGQYQQILSRLPERFYFWSGDDDLSMLSTAAGGHGVISVIAQGVPIAYSQMIRACLRDDMKEARRLNNALQKIIGLIFKENNPSGIKGLLAIQDICSTQTRLPVMPISDGLMQEMRDEFQQLVEQHLL